jgi:hypothetical protein
MPKRLKRFSDFIAERESLRFRAAMDSFQEFAVGDGALKSEHAVVDTLPKLSSDVIRRKAARKKKRAIIPIDATWSGEFPQRNEDYEARLHHCIMLLEHLNDMSRPFVVEQARRIMAAIRSSNSTISELARLSGAERYSRMMMTPGNLLLDCPPDHHLTGRGSANLGGAPLFLETSGWIFPFSPLESNRFSERCCSFPDC